MSYFNGHITEGSIHRRFIGALYSLPPVKDKPLAEAVGRSKRVHEPGAAAGQKTSDGYHEGLVMMPEGSR
jgi:hypothetical protein